MPRVQHEQGHRLPGQGEPERELAALGLDPLGRAQQGQVRRPLQLRRTARASAAAGEPIRFHASKALLWSRSMRKCSSSTGPSPAGRPASVNSTSAAGPGTSSSWWCQARTQTLPSRRLARAETSGWPRTPVPADRLQADLARALDGQPTARPSGRTCGRRSAPAARCRWSRAPGTRRSRAGPRTRTPRSPPPRS